MTKQTIDSDLSLAILGLLSIQPLSGYGLRKVFLTTAMKAFSASPGAIYPALRRLEKEGFIEGTIEKKDTLRPRMVFGLTRQGRTVLLESLRRPVTREDVIRRMSGLVLKFSFMSSLVGDDTMLRFLRGLTAEMEGYLKELEAEFRRSDMGPSFSGRAALAQGIEVYRATARWARKTHDEFKKSLAAKGERS